MNKINVKVLSKEGIIISNNNRLVARNVDKEMSEIMMTENKFIFTYDQQPTEIELRIDKVDLKEDVYVSIINEFLNHLFINKSISKIVLSLSSITQYNYLIDKIKYTLGEVREIVFKIISPNPSQADRLFKLMPNISSIEFMCNDSSDEDIADVLKVINQSIGYHNRVNELILLSGCKKYEHSLRVLSELSISSLTIDTSDDEDLKTLGTVKSISRLKLKSYDIESFPDPIGRMKNLTFLDISETQISKDTYKLCIEINEKYGIPEVVVPTMQIR